MFLSKLIANFERLFLFIFLPLRKKSKFVNVFPLTKRLEVENENRLEKQITDIEEGTLEDILDHFDPMNSAELALLDEEIEKNRE